MRSNEQEVRGSGAVKAALVTVPLFLSTTTWPGSTSCTCSTARSNTVMSGARSEAKAMTSSFWK